MNIKTRLDIGDEVYIVHHCKRVIKVKIRSIVTTTKDNHTVVQYRGSSGSYRLVPIEKWYTTSEGAHEALKEVATAEALRAEEERLAKITQLMEELEVLRNAE